VDRWDQLPGINPRGGKLIVAEVGADLNPFADGPHLASWGGMCPGHQESAGKRQSGKTRKGSKWLRRALVEAAHGAARTKNSYCATLDHRLAGRRGRKRALVAVDYGHNSLALMEAANPRRSNEVRQWLDKVQLSKGPDC